MPLSKETDSDNSAYLNNLTPIIDNLDRKPGAYFQKGVLATYLPIKITLLKGGLLSRGGLTFGRGLTFHIIQYTLANHCLVYCDVPGSPCLNF